MGQCGSLLRLGADQGFPGKRVAVRAVVRANFTNQCGVFVIAVESIYTRGGVQTVAAMFDCKWHDCGG